MLKIQISIEIKTAKQVVFSLTFYDIAFYSSFIHTARLLHIHPVLFFNFYPFLFLYIHPILLKDIHPPPY